MINRRTIAVLLLLSAVIVVVIARSSYPRADEDEEEKPIVSSAARVSRDANGQIVIALPPAAQKEIGIVTEILKPVTRPLEVEAYGFVLDPAPLQGAPQSDRMERSPPHQPTTSNRQLSNLEPATCNFQPLTTTGNK